MPFIFWYYIKGSHVLIFKLFGNKKYKLLWKKGAVTSDETHEHMQIRHFKERIKGKFPLVCQTVSYY